MGNIPQSEWTRKSKVKLIATDGHPHLEEGAEIEIHPNHYDKLTKNKWAVEPGQPTKVKNPAKPLSSDPDKNQEPAK